MANQNAAGLALQNFSSDLRNEPLFLSAAGSDCGIANLKFGICGGKRKPALDP
jgi:hypothetical protein